jgi:PilZ domain-containing protein
MNASDCAWRAFLAWKPLSGQPHAQEAAVVALDSKTVKLAVAEEIPSHQQCTISLNDADGVSRLTVQATVHYVRTVRGESQVTLRWAVPLSSPTLNLLSEAGLYERRVEPREPIALEAPAWPELTAPAGVIPVSIIDLSIGGCCVRSPLAVDVGHRLMVHVWDEQSEVAAVRMRVQWQQPSGSEFLLGCAFTHRGGRKILASFVEQKYAASGGEGRSSSGRIRRLFFLGQAGITLLGGVSAAAAAIK